MIITYFIIVLIAILLKILHFPGASLLFLIGPIFPLIDILIQAIRKKENKEVRILSSISIFLISIFLLLKFLHWPLSGIAFLLALAISAFTFIRFFQKKVSWNLRFVLFSIFVLFSTVNFSLKRSSFRLVYMLEDPFKSNSDVPEFIVQRLAYEFYQEGDYSKAEQLIHRNIKQFKEYLTHTEQRQSYLDFNQRNLDQSISDLENIRKRTWNNFDQVEVWL